MYISFTVQCSYIQYQFMLTGTHFPHLTCSFVSLTHSLMSLFSLFISTRNQALKSFQDFDEFFLQDRGLWRQVSLVMGTRGIIHRYICCLFQTASDLDHTVYMKRLTDASKTVRNFRNDYNSMRLFVPDLSPVFLFSVQKGDGMSSWGKKVNERT